MPWTSSKGTTAENVSDLSEEMAEAILTYIGIEGNRVKGSCTVTAHSQNITVSDFQARPIWFANLMQMAPETEA